MTKPLKFIRAAMTHDSDTPHLRMARGAIDTVSTSGESLSLLTLWRIVWGRAAMIAGVTAAFMLMGFLLTSFGIPC